MSQFLVWLEKKLEWVLDLINRYCFDFGTYSDVMVY